MSVRIIKREEMLDYWSMHSIAFRYPFNPEQRLNAMNTDEGEKNRIVYGNFTEDDKLTSGVICTPFTANLNGNIVGLVGIGGVSTLPEYRRNGDIRSIMSKLLHDRREAGDVLSGLYPFSHEYYRKFGYENSSMTVSYEFKPEALSSYRKLLSAKIVQYTAAEPDDDLQKLADCFTQKYTFCMNRDAQSWRLWFRKNPINNNMLLRYKFYDDKGLCAYCAINNKNGEVYEVNDLLWRDSAALKQVFGFLGCMSNSVILHLPDNIVFESLVDEPHIVTPKKWRTPMGRIVNVEKALACIIPCACLKCAIKVNDAFIPENSGTYVIENGTVRLDNAAEADIEVSIQALFQLVIGVIEFDTIVLRNDVTIFSNEDALRKLFVKRNTWHTEDY